MDTTQTITHISLCAGYGGIDLGLRRAIPNLRTVAFSEIEGFACANLVSKMEEGLLDCAPIWTDLKTFPWRAFRDRVDILSGGYPCQPFSAAGKRLGTDDPRHLWPFIADGIRLLRPRLCFFENVEGHISLGLREVIGELESMGYSVSWGIFSAREVGAPHQRKRVFILAHSDRERGQLSDWWRESAEQVPVSNGEERRAWPSRPGQPQHGWEPPRVVGNADCFDRRTSASGWINEAEAGSAGEGVGDTSTAGLQRCGITSEVDGEGGGAEGKRGEFAPASAITGDAQRGEGSDMANARSICGQSPDSDRVCRREICESPRRSEVRSEDCGCGESDGGERASAGDSEGGMPRKSSGGDWRESAGGASEGRQLGDTEEQGCGRLDDESGETGGRETRGHADLSSNPEQQKQWQAEPTLGGDADGTPHWMDYAELSVSCDNRTDELRLLGNGVVPATATLAFQTLLAELLTL